ncbi:hypothetical protein B0H17DRAFT_1331107 [Mycena rosella]|uniref:Uncharacterized protein n=1 Tax=Mycena rosella TaxID=1033263 RepID=A0AAD7DHG7_MYCRO|nr:hypothetical protein B0H17DRAFT_1331107 [Mycena rosella]
MNEVAKDRDLAQAEVGAKARDMGARKQAHERERMEGRAQTDALKASVIMEREALKFERDALKMERELFLIAHAALRMQRRTLCAMPATCGTNTCDRRWLFSLKASEGVKSAATSSHRGIRSHANIATYACLDALAESAISVDRQTDISTGISASYDSLDPLVRTTLSFDRQTATPRPANLDPRPNIPPSLPFPFPLGWMSAPQTATAPPALPTAPPIITLASLIMPNYLPAPRVPSTPAASKDPRRG